MVALHLRNYVPVEEYNGQDFWELEYEEGSYFQAKAVSQNGLVTCTYRLNHDGEVTVTTFEGKHERRVIDEKRKVISQNNGTGLVRLSGGSVATRFANFRRQVFQDFMDTFRISSVKGIDGYGYNSTFLIENTPEKMSKIYLSSGSRYAVIEGNRVVMVNKLSDDSCIKNANDNLKIVSVYNSPWWIYEETNRETGAMVRRLYSSEKKNLLSLEENLKVLFKD